jgi:hypothetical protein
MKKSHVAMMAAAAGCFLASPALAQDSPPTIHVVTVSTFRVPLGPDRGKVLEYMRSWMVPPAKVNPKVLSYRVVQHWYGSNAGDMAIIVEYADLGDLNADCAPCTAWFEEHFPKEGTPEREAVDELANLFFKYYGSHQDQIYSADMSLAKP